jgi:hypothetical protein
VLGPRTVVVHSHNLSKTIRGEGPLLIALGSVDIIQLVTRH